MLLFNNKGKLEKSKNIAIILEKVCLEIAHWGVIVQVLYFCFSSSWLATAVGFLADPASEGAAGTDHTDQQAESIWNRNHISPKCEAVVPAAAGPGTGGPCQAAEWNGQYTGIVIHCIWESWESLLLSVLSTGKPSDLLQWPHCSSTMKIGWNKAETHSLNFFSFPGTLKFYWY